VEDDFGDSRREVFVVGTAEVERPAVRVVFVRFFAEEEGDGAVDYWEADGGVGEAGDFVFVARAAIVVWVFFRGG